jgi:ATP/maltotriose-dependent transcriptional regulator MalT
MVALELHNLAKWCLHWSKAKDALPFAKEALGFFKSLPYSNGWEAASMALLVQEYVAIDEVQKGLKLAKDSLRHFEAVGDLRSQVVAYDVLAGVQLALGKYVEALKASEAGLAVAQAYGDRHCQVQLLRAIAAVRTQAGETKQAVEAVKSARFLARELGDSEAEELFVVSSWSCTPNSKTSTRHRLL